jgi:hypothetical protein
MTKVNKYDMMFQLKVYDPLNCQENTLHLPLGFSCLTSGKKVEVKANLYFLFSLITCHMRVTFAY